MATTSTPFTLEATLNYPPDDGQPDVSRGGVYAGSFKSRVEFQLDITDATTKAVDLGTVVVGAKAFFLEVTSCTEPVMVSVNGGADTWELSQGGFIGYCNPSPTVAGLTALTVTTTTAATVKLIVLG